MSHDLALPLIFVFSIGSLFVAGYLISWVLKRDTGTPAMREISNAIKEGAEAFLRRQNTTILLLAAMLAGLIFVLYGFVRWRSGRPFRFCWAPPVPSSPATSGCGSRSGPTSGPPPPPGPR